MGECWWPKLKLQRLAKRGASTVMRHVDRPGHEGIMKTVESIEKQTRLDAIARISYWKVISKMSPKSERSTVVDTDQDKTK